MSRPTPTALADHPVGRTPAPAAAAAAPTVHGYPRQGRRRELKRALERHWSGALDATGLLGVAADLRRERWQTLAAAGITEVPVGDPLYDHVLDLTVMLGALPDRYVAAGADADDPAAAALARSFAAARGTAELAPLELTKWFDTNYHYLVPELGRSTRFRLDPAALLDQVAQARQLGLSPRPVLLGPYSYLRLAKPDPAGSGTPLDLLDPLTDVYADLLGRLASAGVEWVQLDEPVAVTGLDPAGLDALAGTYRRLSAVTGRPRLLVAGYFDRLGEALKPLVASGIDGLGVDLTGRGAADLDRLAGEHAPSGLAGLRLVAGVVDGRNVWRTDLDQALGVLERLAPRVGRLDVAPSCSLIHVPIDVGLETGLDPEVRGWLAFADQKLAEVATLARGLREGREAVTDELGAARDALAGRRTSPLTRVPAVRARTAAVTPDQTVRPAPASVRAERQRAALGLPPLPTTTIGSFPQTAEVRRVRADRRAGRIDAETHDARLREEIARVVALQERLGLDVLVHGEPERHDMVQYFAEQLDGVVSTEHGWVQSYGSRCVRPPVVVGDVSRPRPMTVAWSTWAASLTERPMKAMLTGPVTILAWSFVRDDLPAGEVARQVALALRDEVADLEAAGLPIVQVDEPALRELLPLRADDQGDYLAWATEAFRLATGGAAATTQVHTHMCYAEFGAVAAAIAALDADVISLEASRSRMEAVGQLAGSGYPSAVGPGVWDIHAVRVPGVEEIAERLRLALAGFPADRLWVNPDCGLKTRGYAETEAALAHLVAAARTVRAELD